MIAGKFVNSVLGAGVVVEVEAEVIDSVLLDNVKVERGAVVMRTIADKGAVIGPDAHVGAALGELTLVGLGAYVSPGALVKAGARVKADGSKA